MTATKDDWLATACTFVQSGGELQSCLYAVAPLDKLRPDRLTPDELSALIRAHAKARVLCAAELKRESPEKWLAAANLEQGLSFFGPFLQEQTGNPSMIDAGASRFDELLQTLERYLNVPELMAELRARLKAKAEENLHPPP